MSGGVGADGKRFVDWLQLMYDNNVDSEYAALFSKISRLDLEYVYLNTISAERFNRHAVRSGWKWKECSRITEEGELENFVLTGNGNPMERIEEVDSTTIIDSEFFE